MADDGLSPPGGVELDAVVVSQLMGYAIMCGSVLLKLPQIAKLLGNRSADGCSEATLAMEVYILSTSYYYGFVRDYPFETYAENGIGAFESLVCYALVVYFNGDARSPARWLGMVALAAYSYAFVTGCFDVAVPAAVFGGAAPGVKVTLTDVLNASLIPIGIASKIPQIVTFYRAKSTGHAAFLSWLMSLCGAVARTFTTYYQMRDPVVLLYYAINVALFVVIVVQFAIYPGAGDARVAKRD